MSVGLKMLVMDGLANSGTWAYSHTMLNCGAVYAYHEKLRELHGRMIPIDTWAFVSPGDDGEPRYGRIDKDSYGEPVLMYRASDIAAIDYDTEYPWLKAAIAYVRALAPDAYVALWWH